MLRTQLAYFDDVDYREQADYLPGFAVPDSQIKKVLIECSLQI